MSDGIGKRRGSHVFSAGDGRLPRIARKSLRTCRFFGASGQMAVEFAVMAPVMAAMAFIFLNALIFVGDCASFDIAARDAIRLQADDGRQAQGSAEARELIERRLDKDYESVEVTCEKTGTGHIRYTASASFSPPFLEGASVFGVSVPALRHEVEFTVSPYRKGVVI
ncbi:MAG: hypothetical protein Q4B69_03045 [Slackia sp.]|nr:hypothetical protein [Slackia sp.]